MFRRRGRKKQKKFQGVRSSGRKGADLDIPLPPPWPPLPLPRQLPFPGFRPHCVNCGHTVASYAPRWTPDDLICAGCGNFMTRKVGDEKTA